MNKVLLAAVALPLLAQGAAARPRQLSVAHVSAPSRSSGSSGSSAALGSTPAVYWGTLPASPAAANLSLQNMGSQSQVVWGSSLGSGSGRGFSGGRSRGIGSSSFWGRRLGRADTGGGAGGTGTAGGATTSGGEWIPSVLMPGQLIRTAGLGALMSQPDAAPTTFAYEAGPIAYQDNKGWNLTNNAAVFQGPKDTPPPTNKLGMPYGNGGGSAGGNGITENTNVQFNSHSNNGNGNGTGGGNNGN